MDIIKEDWGILQEEVNFLNQEVNFLNNDISEIKCQLKDICIILEKLSEKIYNSPKKIEYNSSTDQQTNSTNSTHSSTHDSFFKPLNAKNMMISIGNQGVSTDRQTNRQTDIQDQNSFENAVEMINSLDSIKKELRLKFKRLTEQELLVFSAIYQLDEENGYTDYKTISARLNLTESSIRDYVGRLIKKGIPIEKKKENNKNIHLSISFNLKKMATLSTIMQLRNL